MTAVLACVCLGLAAPRAGAAEPISAPHGSTAADLSRASQLAKQGREVEAVGLYKLIAATAVSPEVRCAAWLEAGRLATTAAEAEASFRRAQDQSPRGMSAAEAGLELGKLYFSLGNYRSADQVLASVQNKLMGTVYATQVNLFRARTAMGLKMYRPASVVWKDLAHARTLAQRADYGVGQSLLADGDPRGALEAFDRYTQSYPAGDYLAAALAGSIRAAEKSGQSDRLNERKARLSIVAPGSWEAEGVKLSTAPAHSAVAAAGATRPAAAAIHPAVSPVPRPAPPAASSPAAPAATKPAKPTGSGEHPRSVPQPRMPIIKNEEAPAPAAAKMARPPAAEKTDPEGPAYLQLGLFSTREHARTLVSDVKAHGLDARVHEISSGGKQIFQVRTARGYADVTAARAAGEPFRVAGFKTQVKPGND